MKGSRLSDLSLKNAESNTTEVQNDMNIIHKVLNYLCKATPLTNFPEGSSDIESQLLNSNVSSYYYNGKISIGRNNPTQPSVNTLAEFASPNKITFNVAEMINKEGLLQTVSNIQCTFVHEYIGHMLRGLNQDIQHYQVYDIQKQFLNYAKTTAKYKVHVESRRSFYFNTYNN